MNGYQRQLRKLARRPGAWERIDVLPGTVTPSGVSRPRLAACESWRTTCWRNNRYSVQISDVATEWGQVVHLWIRRHDGQPCRSWADLQGIKNDLVDDGAERMAVEVFPAVEDLVDAANMYHLWVLPAGFRLPFALRRAG